MDDARWATLVAEINIRSPRKNSLSCIFIVLYSRDLFILCEGTFSYLNSFEKRYKGIILKNVV